MSMVCIDNVHAYLRIHIYIRRGLQCCCLELRAIPEPRIAEQQDCSPAFCLYKREKIVQAKRDKNTIKDPLFVFIYPRDYLGLVPIRFSLATISPV